MPVDYRERLRPVIRYLEQHYREPLDLAVLAERAALSPYHFHRIYKAVTGETPAATVRRLRLENIARQLFYDANASASVKAKSYRDDSGAQAQDFFSLFAAPRETAGQYLAPVLLQRGERLYAVPGVYTNTRTADNLTVIDDEGAQYIVLHSYGWKDLNKSYARLVVRTDKWRY